MISYMSIIINNLEIDVNELGDRHDVTIGNAILYFRSGQLQKIRVTNPDGTTDTMFTKKTEKKDETWCSKTISVYTTPK